MRTDRLLIVPGSIGRSNSRLKEAFVATVSPYCQLANMTVGLVRTGPGPVVKWVVCAVTALPSGSVTPLIVKAIRVFAGNGASGVMVAIVNAFVPVLKLMLAGTTVWPPPLIVTVEAFTVIGSIGPLKP